MRSEYAEALMTTVSRAHLWHFYTKSYAAHDAFGKFYEALSGLADTYIECDIGVNGPIAPTGGTFYYPGVDDAVRTLTGFKALTKSIRDAQEKAGQNGAVATLEEIMALVDQTLYRLQNLS